MKTNLIKYTLFISVLLSIYGTSFAQWTQLGLDIDGAAGGDQFGSVVSLSADGQIIAVGSYQNNNNTGHVRVFQFNGINWIQNGLDIVGTSPGDNFGAAVSLSSDGTVVAIMEVNGKVKVFSYDGESWNQIGLPLGQDCKSVCLNSDGNYLAIGSGSTTSAGSIRVFNYDGDDWNIVGSAITGEALFDVWGSAVSLSDNGLIVAGGATGNDGSVNFSGIGHCRIFEFDGTDWIQRGSDIDGEGAGDSAGDSVSINDDGNIVAVASRLGNNNQGNGSVRVFNYSDGGWVQLGSTINGVSTLVNMRQYVSLNGDGDIMAIGSVQGLGRVSVYSFNGTEWEPFGEYIGGELNPVPSNLQSSFGYSVSLSSNGLIVAGGDPSNDGNGGASGHARIFTYENIPQCFADFNNDQLINTADLNTLLSQIGSICSECTTDLNDDGVINTSDLVNFLAVYGSEC